MAFSKGRYLSGVLGLSVPIVWAFIAKPTSKPSLTL
jgi:hypothetical protein